MFPRSGSSPFAPGLGAHHAHGCLPLGFESGEYAPATTPTTQSFVVKQLFAGYSTTRVLTAVFMSIDPVGSSRSERTIRPRLRA